MVDKVNALKTRLNNNTTAIKLQEHIISYQVANAFLYK